MIVLYENNNLIIQTTGIITNGLLKVVEHRRPSRELFAHSIANTDFIRVKADLPPGKLQVQLITASELMTKNITIDKNENQR